MVDQTKIKAAVRAIENKDSVGTARLISRALAFDAIIANDHHETVEHLMAIGRMEDNLHQKLKFWVLALDAAKKMPEIFLETCRVISQEIEELPDYRIPVAYSLMESLGEKEFIAVVNAVGSATKTGKKTTRKYTKKEKKPEVDTGVLGDHNVWVYPESRSIYKYMYSPVSRTLHVVFTSGNQDYSYYDVSPELFRDLQNAESKGQFFAKHIKVQHSANYR